MPIRDKNEFAEIYDRCSPLAYGLAFKMLKNETDAQDILQQAFLSLWQHRTEFDPTKAQISTWLYTLVRNRCIDLLRRRKTENKISLDGEITFIDFLFEKDSVNNLDNKTLIKSALAQLPEDQRIAIELAYFHGMTQQEISAKLNEPLGTIKTRMRLGMQKLTDILKKEESLS